MNGLDTADCAPNLLRACGVLVSFASSSPAPVSGSERSLALFHHDREAKVWRYRLPNCSFGGEDRIPVIRNVLSKTEGSSVRSSFSGPGGGGHRVHAGEGGPLASELILKLHNNSVINCIDDQD